MKDKQVLPADVLKEGSLRPGAMRRLSDEEIEVWIEVARSVTRRKGVVLPSSRRVKSPAPGISTPVAQAPAASKSVRPLAPLSPLEPRLKRRLQRGQRSVDDVIDLHGRTQAAAHMALRGFLIRAQARGDRLIIVITGKGQRSDDDPSFGFDDARGVLRRLTPHWLGAPDLRSVVQGFEEAGRAHGGVGALYVRLRRGR